MDRELRDALYRGKLNWAALEANSAIALALTQPYTGFTSWHELEANRAPAKSFANAPWLCKRCNGLTCDGSPYDGSPQKCNNCNAHRPTWICDSQHCTERCYGLNCGTRLNCFFCCQVRSDLNKLEAAVAEAMAAIPVAPWQSSGSPIKLSNNLFSVLADSA